MSNGKKGSVFEEAALALVHALSPSKHLDRNQIPFAQLRSLIGDFIAQQQGSDSGSCSVKEENGRSTENGIESDEGNSRMSFEEQFSLRTQSLVRAANGTGSLVSTQNKTTSKAIRKLTNIRERRRATHCSTSFHPIEGDNLDDQIDQLYSRLLDSSPSSIHMFHFLLNSIRDYFSRNTWKDNVENLVTEFVRTRLLLTSDQLCAKYDDSNVNFSTARRLLEFELHVILELHLIHMDKACMSLATSNVLNKMRFMYFTADQQHMKTFLEETVADEFVRFIPVELASIFEELGVALPCDLEAYATGEDDGGSSRYSSVKWENGECGDAAGSETMAARMSPRAPLKLKLMSHGQASRKAFSNKESPGKGTFRLKYQRSTDGQFVKRPFFVPDTPEEKLARQRYKEEMTDEEKSADESVMQTPYAKMKKRARNKRQTEKLSRLLKDAERRVRQAPDRLCYLKPAGQSTSTCVLAKARAKVNLHQRLTQATNLLPVMPSSSSSMAADDYSLDDSVLDRYRKRLDRNRISARLKSESEVFYGRSATRRNLFEASTESATDPSEQRCTRLRAATQQKSRSGRALAFPTTHSCAYMAHALLNVHNDQPFSPPRPPKAESRFKLQRMLRVVCKSRRRRLDRLRLRLQRSSTNAPIDPIAPEMGDSPPSATW